MSLEITWSLSVV